ncbi:MAG: hypothetical protein PHU80_11860, partial [Kiritimatiellae bacterium]|nr:hypothetical protein [Kiritimatiellia bacterium]
RQRLAEILAERITRLAELADKVALSLYLQKEASAASEQQAFVESWPQIKASLETRMRENALSPAPEAVAALIDKLPCDNYIKTLQGLDYATAQNLTAWLEAHARDSVAGIF